MVKGVKEKGPAFIAGALLGAALIMTVIHREQIVKSISKTLKSETKEGQKNEHTTNN